LLFPAFIEISSIVFFALNFSPNSIFFSILSGSFLGGILSYYLGYFGSKSFSRYGKRIKEMKKLIEKWGNYSVFLVSFLPMPFPFSLFAILVGFLKMDVKKFALSLIAGKSLRIGIVLLLLSFGTKIFEIF